MNPASVRLVAMNFRRLSLLSLRMIAPVAVEPLNPVDDFRRVERHRDSQEPSESVGSVITVPDSIAFLDQSSR